MSASVNPRACQRPPADRIAARLGVRRSRACATTPATGTTTRRSPPTSSTPSSSTRTSGSTAKRSSSPPTPTSCGAFPFLFMTGHKLVRFSAKERERLRQLRRTGRAALLRRLQSRHRRALRGVVRAGDARDLSRGPRTLDEAAARHASALPRVLPFPDGPPQTAHELNGWGDDLVHDYLRGGRAQRPSRRALFEQGLRLRVGLRLAQQALPARGQHALRGQYRRLCDDELTLRLGTCFGCSPVKRGPSTRRNTGGPTWPGRIPASTLSYSPASPRSPSPARRHARTPRAVSKQDATEGRSQTRDERAQARKPPRDRQRRGARRQPRRTRRAQAGEEIAERAGAAMQTVDIKTRADGRPVGRRHAHRRRHRLQDARRSRLKGYVPTETEREHGGSDRQGEGRRLQGGEQPHRAAARA